MSLSGFALVITAACCHAFWNFCVKRINAGPELVWLFSFVALILYLPLALYILILERPVFGLWEWIFILGSAVWHLGYFLLLQQGYKRGDLSLVYPTARATGPFLSSTFAVVFLGEAVSLQIAAGAAAVVIGILGLTGGFAVKSRDVAASLIFGVSAGLLIGTYTVWDAYAVSTLLIPPLLLDYASSVGRVVLLAPVAARRRPQIRHLWRTQRAAIVAIAVFNPLAYILVLYALTFTPVIYVAPLREVSVLLTVLLGAYFLREGDITTRLLWASVVLIGVSLLATG